jgi:toxin ParE1/3/4
MENNYILFPKAKEDLENIFKYISVDLVNPEAAMKLISKFEAKFNELTSFPNSNPVMKSELLLNKNSRKCIVENFLIEFIWLSFLCVDVVGLLQFLGKETKKGLLNPELFGKLPQIDVKLLFICFPAIIF